MFNHNVFSGEKLAALSPRYRFLTFWRLVPFIAAALVLAPVAVVVSSLLAPAGDIWRHLLETTLPDLLVNTFWLAAGVISGTAVIGIGLAWFISVYEFPGRRFFVGIVVTNGTPAYGQPCRIGFA